MADQKISADSLLVGALIDVAADFIPIVDMSEPDATKNKKITVNELLVPIIAFLGGTYWSLASGGTLTANNTISGAFNIGFTNTAIGIGLAPDTLTYRLTVKGGGSGILTLLNSSDTTRLTVAESGVTVLATTLPDTVTPAFYATEVGNDHRILLASRNSNGGDNALTVLKLWNDSGVTKNNGFSIGVSSSTYTGTEFGGSGGLLANSVALWNYEAGDIIFGTSNSKRLTILSTGQVGVNTVPTAQLHFKQAAESSVLSTNGFRMERSGSATAANFGFINTGRFDFILPSIFNLEGGGTGTSAISVPQHLTISSTHSGSVGSITLNIAGGEALRVARVSGVSRVSIGGVVSPTARLQVIGEGTTTGLTLLLEDSSGADTFGFRDDGKMYHYVTPANDDALTQVLVRDSGTGEIKYRTAGSLGGGGGLSFQQALAVSTLRL
jgi:hypothetical protein